ncbi:hypothetical protein [Natrinema sp. SYSU A 869]|uniref:hypothetical protein n=1 Tax=Natrinema sp. SYSU A 869 TaxID=2871694 RepID=UPI001CA4641F|nr:hypothetical protein [Natrinema sp. SYSU A 869]
MSEDPWSTSRRTFVKYGAVSTGTLFGASGASADVGSGSTEPDAEPADHGVVHPYQFTPDSRFTVVESGLDWQPDRFSDTYQTNVIAYDHAPSYRAFLFTEPDAALEPDQSLEFGAVQGSPGTAGRRFVTVGLE